MKRTPSNDTLIRGSTDQKKHVEGLPAESSYYNPRPTWLSFERLVWPMVLLSLALHLGLAVGTYHLPIGQMSIGSLIGSDQPINVRRATYDHFLDQGGPADGSAADTTTADAMSYDLIDQQQAWLPEDSFDPAVNLRQIQEDKPQLAATDINIDLPEMDLTDRTLWTSKPAEPDSLQYRDTTGLRLATGSPGSALAQANDLLSGVGVGRGAFATSGNPNAQGATGDGTADTGALAIASPGIDDRPSTDPDDLAVDPISVDPVIPPIDDLPIDNDRGNPPTHLDSDFDYRVTRHEPPQQAGYFRVDFAAKRSLKKLRAMPKDMIFIIDTSGSVPQSWVDQVVRGVQQSLPSLNEGDRFNIVFFSESASFFRPNGIAPVNKQTLAEAKTFLTSAQSKGFTDVNAALRRLLVRDVARQRVYELILISDGKPTRGVMDTKQLINLITRDNDMAASIYCVGVGRQQDRELLDFLSYRNKGFSIYAAKEDHVAGLIRDLTSRLRYPLIKNVQLRSAGLDGHAVYPQDLPNIHQGERFAAFGRYDTPDDFTIHITGIAADGPIDFTFKRDLAEQPKGPSQIANEWAFRKLHHLYSEMIIHGETDELKRQIQQLRNQFGLRTLY